MNRQHEEVLGLAFSALVLVSILNNMHTLGVVFSVLLVLLFLLRLTRKEKIKKK